MDLSYILLHWSPFRVVPYQDDIYIRDKEWKRDLFDSVPGFWVC